MSPATPGTPAYQVPNVVPAFASQPPHVQPPNYEMEFAGNYPSHFHSPGAFPPPSQQPLQPTPQWNVLSQAKPPAQLNNLSLMTPAPQAAEAVPATYNGDSATNLSNLLMDMDSQQLTQLNSAELSGLSLSLLDGHFSASASEAAAQVKQEAVARMDAEQDNMTDSFTKLTTATLNEITNLGNMYNRNNNWRPQPQENKLWTQWHSVFIFFNNFKIIKIVSFYLVRNFLCLFNFFLNT